MKSARFLVVLALLTRTLTCGQVNPVSFINQRFACWSGILQAECTLAWHAAQSVSWSCSASSPDCGSVGGGLQGWTSSHMPATSKRSAQHSLAELTSPSASPMPCATRLHNRSVDHLADCQLVGGTLFRCLIPSACLLGKGRFSADDKPI